jgi:hypothetical protein
MSLTKRAGSGSKSEVWIRGSGYGSVPKRQGSLTMLRELLSKFLNVRQDPDTRLGTVEYPGKDICGSGT